jgi:hypothetical protein
MRFHRDEQTGNDLCRLEMQLLAEQDLVIDVYVGVEDKSWKSLVDANQHQTETSRNPKSIAGDRDNSMSGNVLSHNDESSISVGAGRRTFNLKDAISSPRTFFSSLSPNSARLLKESQQQEEITLDTFAVIRNPSSLFLSTSLSHYSHIL